MSDAAYQHQSTFMGDVLFTAATTTLSISQTIAGPATILWEETLTRGSWFASPVHLLQYMAYSWNNEFGGGVLAVTVDADPESTTYGKMHISPDVTEGAVSALVVAIGDAAVAAECGLTGVSQDFGAVGATGTYFSSVLPYLLTPVWPLLSYTRNMEALSGYSSMTHSGSTRSFAGHIREQATLAVTLDRRDSGYTEVTAWRLLWNKRWAAGRGVLFYLDRTDIPSAWTANVLIASEVLVITEDHAQIRTTRLIPWKEYADRQDALTFGVRPPTGAGSDNEAYPAAEISTSTVTDNVYAYYDSGTAALGLITVTNPIASGDATLLFWYQQDAAYDGGNPINGPTDIVVSLNLDGGILFNLETGGASSAQVEGTWLLLGVTANGTSHKLYINGALEVTKANVASLTADPLLGEASDSIADPPATYYPVHKFANIAFFDRLLTTTEMAALYAAGVGADYRTRQGANWAGETPSGYWRAAPVARSVANDGSSGASDVTLLDYDCSSTLVVV